MDSACCEQLPLCLDEEAASSTPIAGADKSFTHGSEVATMRRGIAICVLGMVATLAALVCMIGHSKPELTKRERGAGALVLHRQLENSGMRGQHPVQDDKARSLTFVTVETEPQLGIGLEMNRFHERTGAQVHNVGKGEKTWDVKWTAAGMSGYSMKIKLWQKFARASLAKPGADEELLVLVDNRDLFWAGCELSDLRARYATIVGQSSSSIVFSAEPNCLGDSEACKSVPEPPAKFVDSVTPYQGGCSLKCNGTWHDICTPCGKTSSSKYLNSGFIMGPLKPISQMLDWLLHAIESGNYSATLDKYGDQGLFIEYWLKHPDRVALDYGGELCMTATWLGVNAFHVNVSSGKVYSPMLGNQPACFVHGAGPGKVMASWLLRQLSPGEEMFMAKYLVDAQTMPLIRALLTSLPDQEDLHNGTDNFLDIPSPSGDHVPGSVKGFVSSYQGLKAQACPHATCTAESESKRVSN